MLELRSDGSSFIVSDSELWPGPKLKELGMLFSSSLSCLLFMILAAMSGARSEATSRGG
jgi:hypothetical protein